VCRVGCVNLSLLQCVSVPLTRHVGQWCMEPSRKCGASLVAMRIMGAPSTRPGLTSCSARRGRLALLVVEAMRRALLGSERKSSE
jgi:hypothetical protein